MDISEILDNLGYLAAPLVVFFLFRLVKRIPQKWLRISAHIISVLVFIICGVALILDLLFLVTTERRPAIVSPDGKHFAVIYWTNVIFDHNYVAVAHISIRSRCNPIATEVFADGVVARSLPDLLNDPEVRWLDGRHLLISSRSNGKVGNCPPGSNRFKGIEVLCRE